VGDQILLIAMSKVGGTMNRPKPPWYPASGSRPAKRLEGGAAFGRESDLPGHGGEGQSKPPLMSTEKSASPD